MNARRRRRQHRVGAAAGARVGPRPERSPRNIVAHRDANGAVPRRARRCKKVPRLGPKAFEQCAGFLRIRDGDDPLDASGVHPEAYPVVRAILDDHRRAARRRSSATRSLLRGAEAAGRSPTSSFGVPTVTDILAELEKPGRDPRPAFKTATFQEGVEKIVGPEARHDARGRGHQRRRVRRLRRRRRAPGRAGAHLGDVATASSRTRARW